MGWILLGWGLIFSILVITPLLIFLEMKKAAAIPPLLFALYETYLAVDAMLSYSLGKGPAIAPCVRLFWGAASFALGVYLWTRPTRARSE